MQPKSTCTSLHVSLNIDDDFSEVDDDFWPSVNAVNDFACGHYLDVLTVFHCQESIV